MKLVCERKKELFKNLTINKEYEAVEDGEVYIVTNDAGLRSRYAKGYFRVLPAAPITRNLLDLLKVTYNYEEGILDITLNRTNRVVDFDNQNSAISCGINELSGIASLKRVVNELYAAKMVDIIGSKTDMFKAILEVLFEELREGNDKMCWLLSDENRTADAELDTVLDEMSIYSHSGINPNNQHNITLWVIQ
jgi:hypothetical protein